jgi:S-(hydroxymethyl)glutathione dehydrogenase/alcohol dehydrogenase
VPEEMVVPIRKDMPWPQAALVGCCVATGVGAVTRHAKIEAGSTVLVIGCGGVGLNAVQGAVLSGASKIIAADILDNKLEMAKTFGATHTINTGTNEDAAKKVKEITGGLGVDYSFDAVSIDKTQALAFDSLAPGGHAVAVGISATTVRASYSPFMMVFTEKTVSGTFYGSVRPDLDFPILVDHYMNKRLNIDGLISRTYKLADINEGFKKMMAGEVARGVVVFD